MPSISADGRYIGFFGGWTGFGSQTNNGTDVFVKDMQTGAITNEHLSSTGQFGGSGSGEPVISADGNWLAFWSNSQLVPGTFGSIYVANTHTQQVLVASETAGGADANGSVDNPDISADGRHVVFESRSTNFTANADDGGDADSDCTNARISADGRFVVFSSAATNLTATQTGSGKADIYLWDRTDGSLTNLTGSLGGNFESLNPDVSFDADYSDSQGFGLRVVFETGKALVPDDTNNTTDIYLYTLATDSFTRVSTRANGAQHAVASTDAAISQDGRWVVFRSADASTPLTPGDNNGYTGIFVKDLLTGQIALVSRTANAQANQSSGRPEISAGGDWIVFESSASNLAASDDNGGGTDVFRISNPLLKDVLAGGAGDDTYVLARADTVQEEANGGTDTVRASISYTLGANVENLVLTGTTRINGTGNALNNVITGNSAANVLKGWAAMTR